MAIKWERDTKYKPQYCEELIEHMAEGGSIRGFAGKLRISSRTLYDWVEKHSDFKLAKEIGANASFHWWETQGKDGVWDKTELDENGKPLRKRSLNASVWIYNMKNRFKWRSEPEVEIEINNNNEGNKAAKEFFDEFKKLLTGYANERKGK